MAQTKVQVLQGTGETGKHRQEVTNTLTGIMFIKNTVKNCSIPYTIVSVSINGTQIAIAVHVLAQLHNSLFHHMSVANSDEFNVPLEHDSSIRKSLSCVSNSIDINANAILQC